MCCGVAEARMAAVKNGVPEGRTSTVPLVVEANGTDTQTPAVQTIRS